MRLLLLNYEFPPLGGGAANATLQILKEFRRVNADVIIDVITSSTGRAHVERMSDHITIHYVDIYKKGSLHKQSIFDLLWYSIGAYFKAKKLKRVFRYDGIHAFFGIPCGYIASKLGLPYIVSLRGSDVPFYNKKYFWLDTLFFARMSKRVWKKARAVTANSEGLKELALRIAPLQDIQVIRNGVHTHEFVPTQHGHDRFTILSTSRLVYRKGITYLIDAFVQFHRTCPDAQLYIVGEGEKMESLKSIVQDTGAEEAITFFGAIPHEKMIDIYHQSDIFALPSMNEGMSNSLLEAMSSGLAIVATDTGDAKHIVVGGKIIPKHDAQIMADFFQYAYTHPQELQEMKKQNAERAREMSWESVAEQTKKLYSCTFRVS